MVNYFSYSPSSINGGGCMCGTSLQTLEPFYEDSQFIESGANSFYDGPNPVSPAPASDPISGLFSQFFESPADQQPLPQASHISPVNPVIDNVSQKMGLSPSTFHTMIQQTASSFGINPAELRENVSTFLAQFGVSKETIQSVLKEIASQIGLNNKMGYSGTVHPKTIQKLLEKSNIPVKQNASPVSVSANHVNSVNKQVLLEALNQTTPPQNVLQKSVSPNQVQKQLNNLRPVNLPANAQKNVVVHPNTGALVKPNTVEVPVVLSNQGHQEPVVVKQNGVLTTPSNKPLVVTNTGVLANKQNGVPVTVNNAKVVKNSAGQLVNSHTGNPVTVIPVAAANAPVVNQTVKRNGFQNAAQNNTANVQPTYTDANWQKKFPKMTANNIGRIKNYSKQFEGVNFNQVDPASFQSSIDKFLQEYGGN